MNLFLTRLALIITFPIMCGWLTIDIIAGNGDTWENFKYVWKHGI